LTVVCSNSGDLVIALDSSGSVGEQNFAAATNFLTQVVRLLDLDSAMLNRSNGLAGFRVGMLTFGSDVNTVFQLNTNAEKISLLKALAAKYIAGRTNTASAIRCGIDLLQLIRMTSLKYLASVAFHCAVRWTDEWLSKFLLVDC